MVTSKLKAGIAALAACGVIAASPALAAGANPLIAAGAMRSAQALPLLAASVGSVPYVSGAENTWRCVSVTDEALKLKDATVNVDAAGRVVVDPQGAPFSCRSPVSNYQVEAGAGGFPIEILGGILGLGGAIVVVSELSDQDNNDSMG